MTGTPSRSSWPKRIFLVIAGFVSFLLLFVIALRITVSEMYRGGGIESSRAMGLSAPSWDERSMWSSTPMLQRSMPVDFARVAPWESSIARTADLRTHSSSFDRSVGALQQIVLLIKAIWKICAQRLAPAWAAPSRQPFPCPQKNLTRRSLN
jgi:hypothetical protein